MPVARPLPLALARFLSPSSFSSHSLAPCARVAVRPGGCWPAAGTKPWLSKHAPPREARGNDDTGKEGEATRRGPSVPLQRPKYAGPKRKTRHR
eukprot:scaffold3291_cov109-Isochrysis_galbana.AAC.8